LSPQERAELEAYEQGQAEHYKVLNEIQQAMTERDYLLPEVAHLQHEYDLAEHALQWLQQRDGLSNAMLAPESIEDQSWVEACGGNLMLLAPVMVVPGSNAKAMTKPMKPHHIALFPDLYAHKPKLTVIIKSAQNLRGDPSRPAQSTWGQPRTYCKVEIPGKPKSTFQTQVIESKNPEWNHEQKVPTWELGNSLHFSVFKVTSPPLQPGSVVRIIGLADRPDLHGATGRCEQWDQSRGAWNVVLAESRQAPLSIKPVNLEPAEGSADEFLGWCQIAGKKFMPNGYDGPLDLNHAGSSGAVLMVHINPSSMGGVLLSSEQVPDMPDPIGGM
jgi:hypothetical protein